VDTTSDYLSEQKDNHPVEAQVAVLQERLNKRDIRNRLHPESCTYYSKGHHHQVLKEILQGQERVLEVGVDDSTSSNIFLRPHFL